MMFSCMFIHTAKGYGLQVSVKYESSTEGEHCGEDEHLFAVYNHLESIMHHTIKTTAMMGKHKLSLIKAKQTESDRLAQVPTLQHVSSKTIHQILSLHQVTNLKHKQLLLLWSNNCQH